MFLYTVHNIKHFCHVGNGSFIFSLSTAHLNSPMNYQKHMYLHNMFAPLSHTVFVIAKAVAAPRPSPNDKKKAIIVPAVSAYLLSINVGPYIMHRLPK